MICTRISRYVVPEQSVDQADPEQSEAAQQALVNDFHRTLEFELGVTKKIHRVRILRAVEGRHKKASGNAGAPAAIPPLPSSARYHAFISHNWGPDELNRSNHERVKHLNAGLKKLGLKTWFDEEKMVGHVVKQMCEGIDSSLVVIVCITKKYMEKINSDNAADNCQKEFNYATLKKTSALIIPVVMEPEMKNTSTWSGAIGMELGPRLNYKLILI